MDLVPSEGSLHRRMTEHSSRAMAVVNLEGKLVLTNPAFSLLFSTAEEEARGLPLVSFLDERDERRFIEELAERNRRGGRWRDETFGRRGDGSLFPLSVSFRPLPAAEGEAPLLLAEFEDPSDCSATVSRLVQTERLAALGEMVSSLSHELNNPLAIICGYAELLAESAREEPCTTYAGTIAKQAERCRSIVSKLMGFARVHEASPSVVQMNELIRDGLDLLSYELRTRSIHVDLDLSDRLPPTWADGQKLLQAFLVLVQNAMDAMAARGRGRLHVETSIVTGPALVVDVSDDGPGVPPELRHRIFQPFFTTKEGAVGSGLGLPLAYGVVKEHGGWIAEIGGGADGARFRIWLPLRLPAASDLPPPRRATPAAETSDAVRVLVVDDEAEVCALLRRILAREGWLVDTVESVTDALHRIRQHDYDLVYCDVHLPDRSGFDLLDSLARTRPSLVERLVFCTGDGLHPRTARLVAESGRILVRKPFRSEEIVEAGRRVLATGKTPGGSDAGGGRREG